MYSLFMPIVCRAEKSLPEHEEAYQSEEMHGPASETAQNDDGYHVEHAVDKAFESEFGVSVFTGAVLDYFFSYFGKTGSLGQHRYVTVHFAVDVYGFDHFTAVCFQPAVEVVQGEARSLARHVVEQFGGYCLGQRVVALFFHPDTIS